MNDMKPKWHCLTVEEAAVRLHSNASCGLSRKEARSRFKKNGANTLFCAEPRLLPLFRQFLTDPGQLIFLSVALLGLLFGEVWLAGLALAAFLIWYGYAILHLWRMQKRCNELLWYRVPTPLVLRDGKKQRLSADALVVGDLVLLKEGDIVPADLRLVVSKRLRVRFSYVAAEGERPTVLEQDKNADKQYFANDQVLSPMEENMVYGGSEILSGMAVGLVVACSRHTFLGAMEKLPIRSPYEEKGEVLKSVHPYLRLIGFLCMAAMLPLSVVGLLVAPEELTALRVFLPICAWLASVSAVVPRFLMRVTMQRGERLLQARKNQGNGAVLMTAKGMEKLPELTDLFILGTAAMAEGKRDALAACNGYEVFDIRNTRGERLLDPLAEAFWLYRMGEKQIPTAFGQSDPSPYLRGLMEASALDCNAVELSMRQLSLVRGRDEDVLDGESHVPFRLRFCYGTPPLRGCSVLFGANGSTAPLQEDALRRFHSFYKNSCLAGRRCVTVLREERGRRGVVGILAIGEQTLTGGETYLRSLGEMGVRVHFVADSQSPEDLACFPQGESDSVATPEKIADPKQAVDRATVLIGYRLERLADCLRELRREGRVIGVIATRPSHAVVSAQADVAAVCDPYTYRADRQDSNFDFDWQSFKRPAPQNLRKDADVILSSVSDLGGGLAAFAETLAVVRRGAKRARELFSVLLRLQVLRTAVFVLSVLLGMSPITAAGMVAVSVLTDLVVGLLISRGEPGREDLAPPKPFSAEKFFREKQNWLMPLLPAAVWSLFAAILQWTGVLEPQNEPAMLTVSLLLMETVLLLFHGNGISFNGKTLWYALRLLIPIAVVLLLSALLPFVGQITDLGGWTAVSAAATVLAPILALISVMLFNQKKT